MVKQPDADDLRAGQRVRGRRCAPGRHDRASGLVGGGSFSRRVSVRTVRVWSPRSPATNGARRSGTQAAALHASARPRRETAGPPRTRRPRGRPHHVALPGRLRLEHRFLAAGVDPPQDDRRALVGLLHHEVDLPVGVAVQPEDPRRDGLAREVEAGEVETGERRREDDEHLGLNRNCVQTPCRPGLPSVSPNRRRFTAGNA